MKKQMIIPDNVKEAIAVLEGSGFEAFCVGGCVRDFLLGKKPYDFDIATSALPEETVNCFKNYNLVTNGIKHGTVSVIINHKMIEITSYRVDGEYKDNRHPESVVFSRSLSDDLSRRDFTVNAMAYSEKSGLFDIFGGEKDIRNKLIRCVGNPDERFNEDSLRILRAMRFCSVLGFQAEEKTKKSIMKNMPLILNVSAERIYTEFIKMLEGENLNSVIKEFSALSKTLFSLTLSSKKIRALKNAKSRNLRLAVVFLNEDISEFKKLKPDNKTYYSLKKLCENYKLRITNNLSSEEKIKEFLFKKNLTAEELCEALELRKLFSSKLECEKIINLCKKIIFEQQPYSAKSIKVDGKDLMSLGIMGKNIKNALNTVTLQVIKGNITNEKRGIIDYLEKNIAFFL